jgi:hypothetical protein
MLAPVRLGVALIAAVVAAVGAIPRILLAAGMLPDALRPFVWSDVLFVYLRGLSGHHLPYVDTPFEYPPLVALVSGIFSRASDNAVVFVTLWSVLQALLAATTAWTLAGAASARATAWRFALAPQLLLLGAVNFDLLAVAFLSAALIAARARREAGAASFLALGTLSKLFPIAAAPILLARAARPARAALVGAGIIAIGYTAAALAGRSGATGPLYYLVGIGANFDSPWGLLTRVLDAAGVTQSQEIVVSITLVGLAATYLVAVLPLARAADPAIPFGLAVVTTLIWSRLYSPQYSLWLLPLFVLLPLSGRLFALLIAGDIIVFLTVYPLTLVPWTTDDARAVGLFACLVAGVLLRLVALGGTWRALHRLARSTAGARP